MRDGAPLSRGSHTDVEARLRSLQADTTTLSKLPESARLAHDLNEAALWPLVDDFTKRNLQVDQALASLDHVWRSSILDAVSVTDRRIGAFDGEAHRRTVGEYRAADRTAHRHESDPGSPRRRRARDASPRRVSRTESDVVQHQARLKRGHLPRPRSCSRPRRDVLAALKPCWAMSPLVVSASCSPRSRTSTSSSSTRRADHAGRRDRRDPARPTARSSPATSKQLPPTELLPTSGGDEDDEEAEDETLGASAGTRDFESILDVLSVAAPPPRDAHARLALPQPRTSG